MKLGIGIGFLEGFRCGRHFIGQFSIVRLERDAQLIVPVMDYSIPTKECCDSPGCAEDPCELFSRIPFPAAQFTPKGCDCKPRCQPDNGCCSK